jgi:hypothetical protein
MHSALDKSIANSELAVSIIDDLLFESVKLYIYEVLLLVI